MTLLTSGAIIPELGRLPRTRGRLDFQHASAFPAIIPHCDFKLFFPPRKLRGNYAHAWMQKRAARHFGSFLAALNPQLEGTSRLPDRNKREKAKRRDIIKMRAQKRRKPSVPYDPARWLWCQVLLEDPAGSAERFVEVTGRQVGLVTEFEKLRFLQWATGLQRRQQEFLRLRKRA